jgi:drug/metabolite transporter (DMT)-like permease
MDKQGRRFSLTEGITAGFLFGTAAIFIRMLDSMDAVAVVFWRLLIASALLLLALLIVRKRFSMNLNWDNLRHFLILGGLLGLHFGLFVSAVRETTILNATVLVNTTPIFSLIISVLIYRVRPHRIALIGVVLSLIGACAITVGGVQDGGVTSLTGDFKAAFASLAEGFYLNYGRERRKKLHILPTMLFIYLVATLAVAIAGFLVGANFSAGQSWDTILPLLGLGVLPTALAHTLFFSSLSHLKSFEASALALLEPLSATLLGIVLFAEVPTVGIVLGAMVTLVGVFAVAINKEQDDN